MLLLLYSHHTMRPILLTLFLLLLGLPATAQSYYVAIVKGKVFYNDQPVKPRMKIELAGNLRFTTKDDYIKVSGPGGIHTIKPEEKSDGGYEFLRAVTQELFPKAKAKGSFVLSAWVYPGEEVSVYADNQHHPSHFLEGERRGISHVLKPRDYDWLYWVYMDTNYQPRLVPAVAEKGNLILTPTAFRDKDGNLLTAGAAYLFALRDTTLFRKALRDHSSETLFWNTNLDFQRVASKGQPDENYQAPEAYRNKLAAAFFPVVSGLAVLEKPGNVLYSEDLFSDMFFLMHSTGETNIDNFLEAGYYADNVEGYGLILEECYGEMNFVRVGEAFYRYLVEHHDGDARAVPIIEQYEAKNYGPDKATRKAEKKMRKAYYRF